MRQFLPYGVEQVYNRFGGYMLLVICCCRRLSSDVYYPLLNVFDGVLMSL